MSKYQQKGLLRGRCAYPYDYDNDKNSNNKKDNKDNNKESNDDNLGTFCVILSIWANLAILNFCW